MRSKFTSSVVALILALLIGAVSASAYAYASGSATPTSAYARSRPALLPTPLVAGIDTPEADARLETVPFIRTELYFGSERPNQSEVSDTEFKQFLDEEVTPRFPDGLTVLKGFGQFRESDGKIVQESSFVLVLLYPHETLRDSSSKIEEIRTLYKARFAQESVLRVDDPRPVQVSF